MASTYDIGDVVDLTMSVTVDGVATNATAVTLTVTAPDGSTSEPTITNTVVGTYEASFTAALAGQHVYRWVATGTGAQAEDGAFYVQPNLTVRDYVTAAELKLHLGITDTVDDELVERACRVASRAIDKHCGRRFWQDAAVQSRTYRPDCSDYVLVDDISTLTGLIVAADDNDDGAFETTWTITTDFVAEPSNALADGLPVYRLLGVGSESFPTGSRRPTVQVTARFGWPAVPEDVRQATLIKAARLFRRKDTPEGVAGTGEFGVVRITSEDVDVRSLLAPFVRVDTAPGWGIG